MWRILTATLLVALVLPISAVAQEAPAIEKSLPEQLVDSLNGVFGVDHGARATHAKGVVLEGTFTPTPTAASVSKAVHLQKRNPWFPLPCGFPPRRGFRRFLTQKPVRVRGHGHKIPSSKPITDGYRG